MFIIETFTLCLVSGFTNREASGLMQNCLSVYTVDMSNAKIRSSCDYRSVKKRYWIWSSRHFDHADRLRFDLSRGTSSVKSNVDRSRDRSTRFRRRRDVTQFDVAAPPSGEMSIWAHYRVRSPPGHSQLNRKRKLHPDVTDRRVWSIGLSIS